MKNLEFDIAAFEDLAWWIEKDRAKALRIVSLIKEIQRDPTKASANPNLSNTNLPVVGHAGLIKNTASFIKLPKTKSEYTCLPLSLLDLS